MSTSTYVVADEVCFIEIAALDFTAVIGIMTSVIYKCIFNKALKHMIKKDYMCKYLHKYIELACCFIYIYTYDNIVTNLCIFSRQCLLLASIRIRMDSNAISLL